MPHPPPRGSHSNSLTSCRSSVAAALHFSPGMKSRARRTASRGTKATPRRKRPAAVPSQTAAQADEREELVGLARDVAAHAESSPRLTGGDVDADWQAASSSGEESVGGSVATPDQDVVDEIGRALGVEQEAEAPVRASDEILRQRDRLRWHLERNAADAEEGRSRRKKA